MTVEDVREASSAAAKLIGIANAQMSAPLKKSGCTTQKGLRQNIIHKQYYLS